MNLMYVFLMPQPAGAEPANPLMSILPMVVVIAIFWLFMIRPQQKKQKELRNFRSEIKKGDKVVTVGGIYGKVANVKEEVIVLQVDENTQLTVDKSTVLKDSTDLNQQR